MFCYFTQIYWSLESLTFISSFIDQFVFTPTRLLPLRFQVSLHVVSIFTRGRHRAEKQLQDCECEYEDVLTSFTSIISSSYSSSFIPSSISSSNTYSITFSFTSSFSSSLTFSLTPSFQFTASLFIQIVQSDLYLRLKERKQQCVHCVHCVQIVYIFIGRPFISPFSERSARPSHVVHIPAQNWNQHIINQLPLLKVDSFYFWS